MHFPALKAIRLYFFLFLISHWLIVKISFALIGRGNNPRFSFTTQSRKALSNNQLWALAISFNLPNFPTICLRMVMVSILDLIFSGKLSISIESPENNNGGPKSNLDERSLPLSLNSFSLSFSTSMSPIKAAWLSEEVAREKNGLTTALLRRLYI